MDLKDIRGFYFKQIFKSFATAVGCLYLASFEDTRRFACVIGFIASLMTVSWIRDYRMARSAVLSGQINFSDEDEPDDCDDDEYLE